LDGLLPSTVSTADIAKLWPPSDHTKIHYFTDRKFRIEIFQNFYIETKFWNFWGNYKKKLKRKMFRKAWLFHFRHRKKENWAIVDPKKKGNCSLLLLLEFLRFFWLDCLRASS
jgi:hypothetical protein